MSQVSFSAKDSQDIENLLSEKSWNDELASAILLKYAPQIEIYSSASKKLHFFYPLPKKDEEFTKYLETLVGFTRALTKFHKLNSVKVLKLAKGGQAKEALSEALRMIEMVDKVFSSNGGPFILARTEGALKAGVLKGIEKLVLEQRLDNETLASLKAALVKKSDGLQELRETLKYEYLAYPDYLPPAHTFFISSFYSKPNQTRAVRANWVRSQINSLNSSCAERPEISNAESLVPTSLVKAYFTKNYFGLAIFEGFRDLAASHIRSIQEETCHQGLELAVLKALIAIKQYKNDKGALPETLEELLPTYLSEVPQDPFAGKPLQYSKASRQISTIRSEQDSQKPREVTIPETF